MIAADIALLSFSAWFAYAIRFNTLIVPTLQQAMLVVAAPMIAVPVFYRLGVYRSVMRFIDDRFFLTGTRAMAAASLLWAVIAFLTEQTGGDGLPRSVPFIYFVIGTLLVAASRLMARALSRWYGRDSAPLRHALIVGAGDAGRQLVASMREGGELRPVAFLDFDERLHGTLIGGLPVHAPAVLSNIIEARDISDVIVAWPSVPSAQRAGILEALRREPVRTRSLPALSAIASGRHLVNFVREVDLVDVLGRAPVTPRPELLRRTTTAKSVLVTGAGGSIGSELCRQIALLAPERLILLEANEHALYTIERQIAAITECPIVVRLGSVRDADMIERLLRQHGVQTIFHAAAHKHVPLVEENPLEGIRNNLFGTQVLAEAAYRAGVASFVLISTDKAVRPTNVMGATKRWAEMIVQELAERARNEGAVTCFCAVRFGNVLGSSGSVVPLFKEQIAHGGPVTVTHPEMTRYFMSIEEAVGLVIQAAALANGGEIFLLDMGEPVRIIDLARNMIELSGQTFRDQQNPDGEIEIQIIGPRPGEKIHEELLISDTHPQRTAHEKIIVAKEPSLGRAALEEQLIKLSVMLAAGDSEGARSLLMTIALNELAPTTAASAAD